MWGKSNYLLGICDEVSGGLKKGALPKTPCRYFDRASGIIEN